MEERFNCIRSLLKYVSYAYGRLLKDFGYMRSFIEGRFRLMRSLMEYISDGDRLLKYVLDSDTCTWSSVEVLFGCTRLSIQSTFQIRMFIVVY